MAVRPRPRIGRPRGPARHVATGTSTPPPIGGWNARDSIANMSADDAILLDNWVPEQSRVRVRRGSADHLTGLSALPETLMTWAGPSSSKIFVAAGTDIYDASSAGAVGASVVSSTVNAQWQHVNFGTGGGYYLYCVNGAAAPRHYNGSSWAAPTLTGVTATTLIGINIFKRRLFFIENNTLSFWYLPVNAISGTVSEFDLAPLCAKGGYLMAMGTWTIDGGDGEDDYAAFITSEGEVLVYQGLDPGDASLWRLVGVYAIGAPISRRCMKKVAGDLLIITEDGFVSMSKVLAGARRKTDTLSDKISGAVSTVTQAHESKFGWQIEHYPKGSWGLFNVPVVAGSTYHQYVINIETGAWCRFKGMNGACWAVYDNDLYFGGIGAEGNYAVVKADTGLGDNGGVIRADARPAFQYFGSPFLNKTWMARPILVADGTANVAVSLSVDYENREPTQTATFASAGSVWDEAVWDEAAWDEEVVNRQWRDLMGVGKACSLWVRSESANGNIYWASTDWIYETAPSGEL